MNTTIQPYNPDWPSYFGEIRASLDVHLHHIPEIAYSHIGSTSVPSLSALPIIDILLAVTPGNLEEAIVALTSSKKYDRLEEEQSTSGATFSACSESHQYAHRVYVCESDSLAARVHFAIRDTLREDEELRDAYAATKRRALSAARDTPGSNDDHVRAYSRAKHDAIQDLVIASAQFCPSDLAAVFASDCAARWDPITTPRLRIREFQLTDADAMYALEGHDENARYQDWPPWTRFQARQSVLRGIQRSYARDREVVELAVVYEGAFVGRIGARVTPLSMAVSDAAQRADACAATAADCPTKHVDLWFSFLPSSQGKGLATEAVDAFVEMLLRKEKADTEPLRLELEIECDPRNTGSWRLAERLGFSKHSLTERAWESKGEWVDSLVYRKLV
ncbi:hypothetical protein E8E12_001356 [Didymella heteroderae]|uniref:N-acetyltransferase domain-containing protein n=1 Tax=Didymella heteroderae TaxID=1769908 RepID=A0A9P4WLG4_9PLEO|nr:hypothetical protein E8E12_001356 [Didymella heteroderae]